MRIGIDAKWLGNGPPSGRRVVGNLVRELARLADGDELHLFLDARSRGAPLPLDVPAARRHYVWARNNQISNIVVVPRVADRLGLDAVVYQNFVPFPDLARHARVAMVYDAIVASHPELFTRRERLYFRSLRRLTAGADRVCTGSATERDRLVREGYACRERVDVVPNGVDEAFAPRAALPASDVERVRHAHRLPKRFVLCVGRLNVRKNIAALVRAVAHLRADDVSLIIAGAPDGRSVDLHAVAATAGVAHRVRFVGAVSDDELRVLYALADVFCFPSFDEGFGLCPLEAMAAGTPVVVSRIPVLIETCGAAALYADPHDPVDIARVIDALLANASQRAMLAAAGRLRARSFTWERSAEALLDSVRRAVAAVRSARARAEHEQRRDMSVREP